MTPDLLIWGASGHARVVADIVRRQATHRLTGFIDDDPARRGQPFAGSSVVGASADLPALLAQGVGHILIAIGDPIVRTRLADEARRMGFELATAVHPAAVVADDVTLGPGTILAAGAIINPGSTIGSNCIVNTRSSIDHDSRIGDGVHICPGVTMAGHVHVGDGAWVGIGSTVIQKVRIGARCLIGAGSLVLRNVPDDMLAFGSPAKVVRSLRHADERA